MNVNLDLYKEAKTDFEKVVKVNPDDATSWFYLANCYDTLDNILAQKEFIVNITHDPELFKTSTLGNLPQSHFNDNMSLKCADAYFKCEAFKFTEAVKQSDPIKKKDEAIVFK